MIYIYSNRVSEGATQLATWLTENGAPARTTRRTDRTLTPGDFWVNWGYDGMQVSRARILNPVITGNKLNELRAMRAAGVPVPDFSTTRQTGYLGRLNGHQEANDLLHPPERPDYFVQFVPTVREFRVHVFRNLSIRAGLKVPRAGMEPHPRFRAYQAGWALDYGDPCQRVLRQNVRDVAKAAVAALGYDFGAVDVGVREDGTPVVFEVNSAPGLEGETVPTYGRKILAWTRGEIRDVGPLAGPRSDVRQAPATPTAAPAPQAATAPAAPSAESLISTLERRVADAQAEVSRLQQELTNARVAAQARTRIAREITATRERLAELERQQRNLGA